MLSLWRAGEAMSEADNYRANLAACWQRAAKTSDEVEKRAWLEMGEAWRLLIISGYGSATGEDFAVVSLDGLERGNGPWSWDGRRGLARARLNKQPVWISWVVSRAVHLVNSARGMEMLRRPSLAGWLQKCRTHDLRDIYRWLISLTGKYLREDRFRKRAASILRLFSLPNDDQRVSPRQAASRRKFRSPPANAHADTARQRPARRRAL